MRIRTGQRPAVWGRDTQDEPCLDHFARSQSRCEHRKLQTGKATWMHRAILDLIVPAWGAGVK